MDAVVRKVVHFAFMALKFLDVDLFVLPRKIIEVSSKHYHALKDYRVNENGANETKPGLVACLALEMNLYFVTIYVPSQ